MPTYKELFDRIPSVDELETIKQELKDGKEFSTWEDYYWSVKNLCVYDTDSCETELIVKNINKALEKGLAADKEIRSYFDAIKILATLYSQTGDYEKTIEYLNSLMNLEVEIPDWVYHYEIMAEIKTDRIEGILREPFDFIEKLSRNSKNSSAVTRRQRNIFKQFIVEAEKYIQLHDDADVNQYALTDLAIKYGLDNSEGWKIFISSIPGNANEPITDYNDDYESVESAEPLNVSSKLQNALFGEEEVHVTTNRILEKKYAEVISKLEKLERDMERKRQELEENNARLEKLNQENETLISHAKEDKEKREILLNEIQQQQEENRSLKEELDNINAVKQNELEKVKPNPRDEIVGKVHLYLFSAQVGLAEWLNKYLPHCTGDWWRRAVLDSLSYEQRERAQEQNYTMLSQFDLAALLRIASRNWRRITQILFLSQSEYECLQEMFNIRNRWAHMNANLPENSDIKYDLEIIADFMGQVGCSKQSADEVRKFSASI